MYPEAVRKSDAAIQATMKREMVRLFFHKKYVAMRANAPTTERELETMARMAL